MRPRLLLSLLAILVISAACDGGTQPEETAAGAVRIALEGPLSGDQSSTGIDMLNGARLAVEQANEEGGVLGRRIELLPVDDQADPEVGTRVAEETVDRGVFAVVGPYNSAVGVENLPIYVDADVVPIHLTSNSATNGMGFTVQPKDYQVAPVEAEAIVSLFGAERVALLYDPSTYTAGIAEQARELLEEADVEVVAYEEVDPGASDFTALLEEVVAEDPDLIYGSTYFPEGARISEALIAMRSPATCFMGLANQDPGFVSAAGLDVARACHFSGVPSADQFPAAESYVRDYTARFGTDPGTWGSFTYDSVNLLLDAVREAGAWDAAQVREQLAETRDYAGITGSITIDRETGNRVDVPVVILEVDEEGAFVVDPRWASLTGFHQ